MRFVHVNNFDAIFSEDDISFKEDIFKGGHEGAKWSDLKGLNSENIFGVFVGEAHI